MQGITMIITAIIFLAGVVSGVAATRIHAAREQLARCQTCDAIDAWFRDSDSDVQAPPRVHRAIARAAAAAAPTVRVDVERLIHTESGGDPRAIGDNGRSVGLGQLGRAAWNDTVAWCKLDYDYDADAFDPGVNRMVTNGYVNRVLPERYFKAYAIADSVEARIAAYKMGPTRFAQVYRSTDGDWAGSVPEIVRRDIARYYKLAKR